MLACNADVLLLHAQGHFKTGIDYSSYQYYMPNGIEAWWHLLIAQRLG